MQRCFRIIKRLAVEKKGKKTQIQILVTFSRVRQRLVLWSAQTDPPLLARPVRLTLSKGLCLPTSTVKKKKREIAYFVYAALPPDGYESLITALGFTGIPFPDLLADIRIANLLVCPERVGWWVKRGWMETGVWFVQITLSPNARLPVDARRPISPSLSCWSEPPSGSATGTLALTWLLWESVSST